jgi:hypothetical protein
MRIVRMLGTVVVLATVLQQSSTLAEERVARLYAGVSSAAGGDVTISVINSQGGKRPGKYNTTALTRQELEDRTFVVYTKEEVDNSIRKPLDALQTQSDARFIELQKLVTGLRQNVADLAAANDALTMRLDELVNQPSQK